MKDKANQKIISIFWREIDYRDFLKEMFSSKSTLGGLNQKTVAAELGISTSFLSKVTTKKSHLSYDHIDGLARVLKFSSYETLALFDKLAYARANSKELRELLEKRISASFQSSLHLEKQKDVDSSPKELNIVRLLFCKILSVLSRGQGATIDDVAQELGVSVEKVRYNFERMKGIFNIKVNPENPELYHYDLSESSFNAMKPDSDSMYDLSMSLRRLASYSLEKRHPISIVDRKGDEHYISASYIVPLSKAEIRFITSVLGDLMKNISKLSEIKNGADQKQLIGVCFDLFDI